MEMQLRLTGMNAVNILANAFGGLIAAGVFKGMEDVQGIRAWRWLFIIEGCITIFFGFCALFFLPDRPSNTIWLSETERFIAQKHLVDDIGVADVNDEEESLFAGLIAAVTDIKVWLLW
jgi:sugar phosphate permease